MQSHWKNSSCYGNKLDERNMQPKIAVGQRDFVIERKKKKKELWIEKLGAMQTLTPTGWDVKKVKKSQKWCNRDGSIHSSNPKFFFLFVFLSYPSPLLSTQESKTEERLNKKSIYTIRKDLSAIDESMRITRW